MIKNDFVLSLSLKYSWYSFWPGHAYSIIVATFQFIYLLYQMAPGDPWSYNYGFSRFIIYLRCRRCSTNNKSNTVFELFHNAVNEFGIPDRIRSDKGGENIKV